MAECLTVCPKCEKRDGQILMPFNVQGYCEEHKLIWEMGRRLPDGAENNHENTREQWRVDKYHRVGPHADEPDLAPVGPIDLREKRAPPVDLIVDEEKGIAFQQDRTRSVPYGTVYVAEYSRRAGTAIANRLNAARTALTRRYCTQLLDIGIGSGEFIESSKLPTLGYDVNPVAVEWLKERGLFCDPYQSFPPDVDGVTLWDVLEHLPEPAEFLDLLPSGSYLFVSLPIYEDFSKLRASKHFKPDEHYWYFTEPGLSAFMGERGFQLIESNDAETQAGREEIKTFVFRKRTRSAAVSSSPQGQADDAGARIYTARDFGGWDKTIHFVVPAGIGDISWVYSKVRHLRALTGREIILSCPGDDKPKRGASLIRLLPDVHWGGYLPGYTSFQALSQTLPPVWPAMMGTWELMCKPYIQFLAVNMHLEMGNRLETWLPWCPTDFHYPIPVSVDHESEAERLLHGCGRPTFLIYVSNRDKDRWSRGGWDVFSEEEWIKLLSGLPSMPHCSECSFCFVGAEYDADKTAAVADEIERRGFKVARVIGHPLGVTIAAMKHCHYFFSFPSGIGILANVLRIPGVMFLPWVLRDLKDTYADPTNVAEQIYVNWVSPTADELLTWFKRVGISQGFRWLPYPND